MDSFLLKHVVRWLCWALCSGTLVWTGWRGLGRSLWLDEAWVANSIRANSLGEMLWGGAWLQTSPPLFLLAVRGFVQAFGLSTNTLRMVPWLCMLGAAIALGFAAHRLAPRWTALALAATFFPTIAIEYFGAFKQYGAEACAVAVILCAAVYAKRWTTLTVVVACMQPLAYPVVFLLPGLAWILFKRDGPRAACAFALTTGAVFAMLYFVFLRPNLAPALWSYWGTPEPLTGSLLVWAVASLGLAIYAWRTQRWIEFACALPCLLLLVAEALGWYASSPRLRLFVRPCSVLAAAAFFERYVPQRWATVGSVGAIALAATALLRGPIRTFEDYPSAIAYLRANVQAGDRLLVHADAVPGLELYSAILGWRPEAVYGTTGSPCCPRSFRPQRASVAEVEADLTRMVDATTKGRVWLFYSNRPLHWSYLGLDEGDLWRRTLWDRGCPPGEYVALGNLVVSPALCH
jgi:hypothetical protein